MRTFVVKLSRPFADFPLNDLPANRMDLVARCVNAALWLDRDIRRDVEIWFCFSNDKAVCIDGSVRSMNPDERSIAGFFQGLLAGRRYDGIELSDMSFGEVLQNLAGRAAYYLNIEGGDIEHTRIERDPVFVLGDDSGMNVPPGARKLSLGPKLYLTSHCIAILNNWADKHAD